jgi:hypothetical protein
VPQCRKCGEKWDLADGYDACPNCEGGGSEQKMDRRLQVLLWVVGVMVLVAILAATTCTR